LICVRSISRSPAADITNAFTFFPDSRWIGFSNAELEVRSPGADHAGPGWAVRPVQAGLTTI
jgi:hypothetical protein